MKSSEINENKFQIKIQIQVHIYIYIYIEHIYTYMLHKEKYINYTENRGSRPPMKNTDLTGKYYVEVTFS